jgi:glycosyltransferase involved in cell wall biosynthesis
MPKRALVASDSNVSNDPRVLKQVRWLAESGWTVDTLGRGKRPQEVNGAHFAMPPRSLATRLFANIVLPRKLRYRVLVESAIPEELLESPKPEYDLVVLNEIELLPWFYRQHQSLAPLSRCRHLDLHEYAPSQRSGLIHNLLFKRYRLWQTSFVGSGVFTSRSAVSPGVARLYAERFTIPAPAIIRNVAEYTDQLPGDVDPTDIKLIHHGSAAAVRRLDLMIDAMAHIDERFSLHLMLVGSRQDLEFLQRKAEPFGSRVTFHAPVDLQDVSAALNRFDLEVIFIPPATENLRYGLPNKLFESVQGRVGLVLGQSPDMVELAVACSNGVVVDGWEAADLARVVNSLSLADVERLKSASHSVARELSSDSEKERFLAATGVLDTSG